MGFDLERFLRLAGRVEVDDLDWKQAARYGLSAGEARILRYMADTETHTIIYLRDLLAGHSAKSAEICAFMSVWVYEELWHGRAIDRLLDACGYGKSEDHYRQIESKLSWREPLEALLSSSAAWITPRFAAAHMAWGAINEATAAAAYSALERKTQNPVLAKLMNRIAKQERKHFSFYYHEAKRRLEGDRRAQRLCWLALKGFWAPVGIGVGEGQAETLGFIAHTLHGDPDGWRALEQCDASIAQLPGLGWFDLVTRRTRPHMERYRQLQKVDTSVHAAA